MYKLLGVEYNTPTDNKMSIEENVMSQAIKNALNSFIFTKVSDIIEKGNIVTPAILDQWEKDFHMEMKKNDQKIGRNTIRELIVQYILSEFDVQAFGVEPKGYQKHEISETTIRRMKNQRKKKFVDLKIVKAAK